MKKKINYISILLMIAIFLVGSIGTYAWFTSKVESVDNTITTGNLEIKLTEQGEEKDNIETPLFGENVIWTPGHTESTTINIKNTGKIEALLCAISAKSTENDAQDFLEFINITITKINETDPLTVYKGSLNDLQQIKELEIIEDAKTISRHIAISKDETVQLKVKIEMLESVENKDIDFGESDTLSDTLKLVFYATQNDENAVTNLISDGK